MCSQKKKKKQWLKGAGILLGGENRTRTRGPAPGVKAEEEQEGTDRWSGAAWASEARLWLLRMMGKATGV